ncbi:hypothetical protein FJW04_22000 [Mesorhizobium sp. B2-7-3]|uniref:hypothetical protein n=1 Tax=unclassified Mesorhizobium TaxID=325217 RepID=UPI001126DF98|nr:MULTISPECIES: hypothetical protein [unclassified Mesorhizobium]MBZ9927772.1 hypothetical protein [Mesorhizobium sp. BR1-1-4]TPJ12933.1 hypothetical protein FJW04_22000 [Mesorhizobium sp. B2-7-3]
MTPFRAIHADAMTLEALEGFDDMMMECVAKVENFASLAVMVWSDVLKELDKRGRVRLVSGSYDEVGSAIIQRLR